MNLKNKEENSHRRGAGDAEESFYCEAMSSVLFAVLSAANKTISNSAISASLR